MKNKKAVFLDLDGTLLPVDSGRLFEAYFSRLKKSRLLTLIAPDRKEAFRIFCDAADVMMRNEGSDCNDNVFFARIESLTGRGKAELEKPFDDFYKTVFSGLDRLLAKRNGIQRQILDTLRAKGYQTVLATMPVFPPSAAAARLSWVGLSPGDFDYISHYRNSSFLKTHHGYYREILKNTGLQGEDCIMVGNNIEEDMLAEDLGFGVFLVTGYEIGAYKPGTYPSGDLSALRRWAQALPAAEEMG